MTIDDDRARALLTEARERIEAALKTNQSEGGDEELSNVDQHPADAGSELYTQEHEEGERERLHEELAAVERAEERLAAGRYGLSVESGDPIPEARLEAHPTAERTVEEQSRYESGA